MNEKLGIRFRKMQNATINANNKTNDLILNLTPENVTQHSRIE